MQEPWKKAKEEYQNQPLPPQLEMSARRWRWLRGKVRCGKPVGG